MADPPSSEGALGMADGVPEAPGGAEGAEGLGSFLSRSDAAQARAKTAAARRGQISAWSLRPEGDSVLPRPLGLGGGAPGGAAEIAERALAHARSSQGVAPSELGAFLGGLRPGAPGAAPGAQAAAPRRKQKVRERSVNQRFRFRERKPQSSTQDNLESASPPSPEDAGGFRSSSSLAPGLPVRVIDCQAGIQAWCRRAGIGEALDEEILAQRGRALRVLEVNGTRLKVAGFSGGMPSLPLQIFTHCTCLETLQNIAWRTSKTIPVPSDFAECVAALDYKLDPGVEPDAMSDSISMSPHCTSDVRVRRFRSTPAIGWPGVHNKVVRQIVSPGTAVSLPLDSAKIRGRLYAAFESCGGHVRPLAADLPKDAEFRLGDGEVCDMLECATSRMAEGEIAALCCTDAGFVQPGGPYGFEPLVGLSGLTALEAHRAEQSSLDACETDGGDHAPHPAASESELRDDPDHPSEYRILVIFQVLSIDEAGIPGKGRSESKWLEYALDRKEVGTRAFKSGRTRLALERYRRAANLLSVYCLPTPRSPAEELLITCWLNAAQCHLALGDHGAAGRYCDAVLRRDPENVKALFRRASACQARGGPQLQAIEDLSRALARDPENGPARRLLQQLRRAQERRERSCPVLRGACAELQGELPALRGRLEAALARGSGPEAEEALRGLAAALARAAPEAAAQLRLGAPLAACARAPPGDSAEAGRLAAEALAQVRRLVMSAGRC